RDAERAESAGGGKGRYDARRRPASTSPGGRYVVRRGRVLADPRRAGRDAPNLSGTGPHQQYLDTAGGLRLADARVVTLAQDDEGDDEPDDREQADDLNHAHVAMTSGYVPATLGDHRQVVSPG